MHFICSLLKVKSKQVYSSTWTKSAYPSVSRLTATSAAPIVNFRPNIWQTWRTTLRASIWCKMSRFPACSAKLSVPLEVPWELMSKGSTPIITCFNKLLNEVCVSLSELLFLPRYLSLLIEGQEQRRAYEILDEIIGQKSVKREGTYTCAECGFVTTHQTNMKNHIESNHINGEISIPCLFCDVRCPTRSAVRSHVKRHHLVV